MTAIPLRQPANQHERRVAPRVLLIEDDAGDQLLVRRALAEDLRETDLLVIDEGDAAHDHLVRCAEERGSSGGLRPALVLLDLNLPGARGSTILALVRGDRRLRSVPVVVFTTSSREDDIDESYRLGANGYVVKPDSAAAFIRAVRAICEFWLEIAVLPRR